MEHLAVLRDMLKTSPSLFHDLIRRPDMVQDLRLHKALLNNFITCTDCQPAAAAAHDDSDTAS